MAKELCEYEIQKFPNVRGEKCIKIMFHGQRDPCGTKQNFLNLGADSHQSPALLLQFC